MVIGPTPPGTGVMAALEREQIMLAMKRARGVKAQAAEALGISRPTLDRKIDEYAIDWLEEGNPHPDPLPKGEGGKKR